MNRGARWMAAVVGAAALASCGGGTKNSQTQNNVDALRNAADQSSPAAAEVLRNEASNLSGQNTALPPSDPNSPTQQAMNKAGRIDAAQSGGAAPAGSTNDATPAPAR